MLTSGMNVKIVSGYKLASHKSSSLSFISWENWSLIRKEKGSEIGEMNISYAINIHYNDGEKQIA